MSLRDEALTAATVSTNRLEQDRVREERAFRDALTLILTEALHDRLGVEVTEDQMTVTRHSASVVHDGLRFTVERHNERDVQSLLRYAKSGHAPSVVAICADCGEPMLTESGGQINGRFPPTLSKPATLQAVGEVVRRAQKQGWRCHKHRAPVVVPPVVVEPLNEPPIRRGRPVFRGWLVLEGDREFQRTTDRMRETLSFDDGERGSDLLHAYTLWKAAQVICLDGNLRAFLLARDPQALGQLEGAVLAMLS